MVDIGYKNYINERKVRKLLNYESSKGKWLKKEAIAGSFFIDCTQGRKANSVVVMKSGHVILSFMKSNSILKRLVKSGLMLGKRDDCHIFSIDKAMIKK